MGQLIIQSKVILNVLSELDTEGSMLKSTTLGQMIAPTERPSC